MSDVMLFGVLRMPYEMAMSGEIARRQFYGRAQEAADRIEQIEAENKLLRASLGRCSIPDALDKNIDPAEMTLYWEEGVENGGYFLVSDVESFMARVQMPNSDEARGLPAFRVVSSAGEKAEAMLQSSDGVSVPLARARTTIDLSGLMQHTLTGQGKSKFFFATDVIRLIRMRMK